MECEHPGKERIDASLNGALYALAIANSKGVSALHLMMVLHALFCQRCIDAWAREYSNRGLISAIGQWVETHPHVQTVPIEELDSTQAIARALNRLQQSRLN